MQIKEPHPHKMRMILDYYDDNKDMFKLIDNAVFIGIRPGYEEKYVIDEMSASGCQCLGMEIWRPNCEICATQMYPAFMVNADMMDISKMFVEKSVGMIWAKQVIEHVDMEGVKFLLEKFTHVARQMVIIECPYGVYHQGPYEGNVYESHKSYLYPDAFNAYGYRTYEAHEIENPTPGDPPRHGLLAVWMSEQFMADVKYL